MAKIGLAWTATIGMPLIRWQKLNASTTVPVEVFHGTLWQAMGAAASANTRNKLAMSSVEKSNAAWRLVAMTSMTKVEAAHAAGVSESTVANMSRVFNLLEARVNAAINDLSIESHGNFRDLNWDQAKRLAEGRDEADFDRDEANEKKANEMALALRKAIGKEGSKQPEILARALELYDSRLPEQLADFWGNPDDSEEEELEVSEHLYTVLPLHAVWAEINAGTVQASRIVSPSLQRSVAMVFTKTKGPAKAVSAVAQQIQQIVDEMAHNGMWRLGPMAAASE